jgi:hypothetical protein
MWIRFNPTDKWWESADDTADPETPFTALDTILPTSPYGEMYRYNTTDITPFKSQSLYHALTHYAAGLTAGFTFTAGISGAIIGMQEGDVGDGLVIIVSAGHGLSTGDVVSIVGTVSYNGIHIITYNTVDKFIITATWAGSEEGGFWYRGSRLKLNSGYDGIYKIVLTMSGSSAAATKLYRIKLFQNVSSLASTISENTFTTTISNVTCSGLVSLAANDVIWVAMTEVTSPGTDNFVISFSDVNLTRL